MQQRGRHQAAPLCCQRVGRRGGSPCKSRVRRGLSAWQSGAGAQGRAAAEPDPCGAGTARQHVSSTTDVRMMEGGRGFAEFGKHSSSVLELSRTRALPYSSKVRCLPELEHSVLPSSGSNAHACTQRHAAQLGMGLQRGHRPAEESQSHPHQLQLPRRWVRSPQLPCSHAFSSCLYDTAAALPVEPSMISRQVMDSWWPRSVRAGVSSMRPTGGGGSQPRSSGPVVPPGGGAWGDRACHSLQHHAALLSQGLSSGQSSQGN